MLRLTAHETEVTGLRIAIIGFYGHLNAGDDLLQYAVTRILQGNRLLVSSWLPGSDLLNRCDLVIVGGGSIWPGHSFFENGIKLARQLHVPLAVVGISASREDPHILEQTLPLIEKAVFFHVRDEASKKALGSHPAIRVGADLFYWVPWDAGFEPEPAPRIAALSLRSYNRVEWNPSEIVMALRDEGYSIAPFPFYFGSVKYDPSSDLNDKALLNSLGLSVVSHNWSPEPLRRASVVIAMRFHALLIGIRLGCPIIGFDFHPKLKSFFSEMNIPELCVPLNQPEKLKAALRQLEEDREKYLSTILKIRDSLLQRGQRDLDAFLKSISHISPQSDRSLMRRILSRIV